jgi:hypothetical protein
MTISGGVAMKIVMIVAVLFLAALPVTAGTLFSGMIDPEQTTPTIAGTYAPGLTLNVTVTGTVNLLGGSNESYLTNPDGSLVTPLTACVGCFSVQYLYANAGALLYPTTNGGDGTNHFPGGGINFDMLNPVPYAPEGKQTTDTSDPGALRLGALAYTFATDPTATDWKLLVGTNGIGTLSTDTGGVLKLIVVDTYHPNDTGGYNVTISDTSVPEPSAAWLAFSGVALLGLTRLANRCRAR